MKKLITFIALLLINTQLLANDITKERGYVDFGELLESYGEPKVQIDLNGVMLKFIAKLSQDKNKGTMDFIDNLRAVRVVVYDIKDDNQEALETVKRLSKKIKAEHWMQIVAINEKSDNTHIFTKMTGEVIDGLVVMSVSGDKQGGEAVFINIVGNISPENIGKVTDSLNIDLEL